MTQPVSTQIPSAASDALSLLRRSLPSPTPGQGQEGDQNPGAGALDSLDLSALAGNLAKDHKAIAIMELHYQSMHSISTAFDGTKYSRTEIYAQTFDMKLTVAGDPEAAKALFEKMKAEWTPDKVSERISNFAVSGFGLPNLPQDRATYRDFIQKAVEEGYGQAKSLLGALSKDVAGSLEETMQKVRDRLDAWVKGPEASQDPEPASAAL